MQLFVHIAAAGFAAVIHLFVTFAPETNTYFHPNTVSRYLVNLQTSQIRATNLVLHTNHRKLLNPYITSSYQISPDITFQRLK